MKNYTIDPKIESVLRSWSLSSVVNYEDSAFGIFIVEGIFLCHQSMCNHQDNYNRMAGNQPESGPHRFS